MDTIDQNDKLDDNLPIPHCTTQNEEDLDQVEPHLVPDVGEDDCL